MIRTPFVESASRVQRITIQGNGSSNSTITPVTTAKFSEQQ
jgi:hypothetical protein